MPLTLNSTGGGSVTLDSGSTPNNVTITLPGTAGTMATLASVTNNGVVYVNSSGQPTSGSGLVFDSSGNLGIGTSSPASPLHIATASAELVRLQGTASAGFIRFVDPNGTSIGNVGRNNTNDIYLWNHTANSIRFGTNNTATMILDSSGNLGLGVTPSATSSTYKNVQNGGAVLMGKSGAVDVYLNANATFNSGWKYIYDGVATKYSMNDTVSGGHTWFTAPSGTAGNAITFTQAMTLDASGNLGVALGKGIGAGNGYNGNTTAGGYGAFFPYDPSTGNTNIYNSAYPITFGTNGSERMRITSGGEVYIAGTTDQGAYNLQCNGTGVWGAGAYVNGSDARLKEEVTNIDSGLDVVAAMRPVTYRYKADYSKDQSTQPGFIAQELQQALAATNYVDGVVQAGPEYLNVAYQNLIPILTKAIQELKAELDDLKAKVQA